MHNLFRLIGRFCKDKRGNIAVTFVIASLPIMSAIGCAVDYSLATRMKAKMQSAADAASVAAISKNSPGFIAAAAMTSSGSVTAGVTDAQNIFDGDIYGVTGYQNLTRLATVTKTGVKLASNVTFSADVPTTFMKVIGVNYQKLTVTGSSSSSASLPPYLDFYLMLDVSGSMGLPSTPQEAQRMQYLNPDNYVQYPTGCTLACHFSQQNGPCTDGGTQGYPTNGYCMGYAISRVSPSGFAGKLVQQSPQGKYPYKNKDSTNAILYNKYWQLPSTITSPSSLYAALPPVASCDTDGTDLCIQLRLDAVGYALNDPTNGLFAVAHKKTVVANQFRVGLYPYITAMNANYFPLTSSINNNRTTPGNINYAAANLATLLDTNLDPNLGSGGTRTDLAFRTMGTTIATVGDGSSATSTLPYVFLVTDGAVTPQQKGVPNGSWSGSNWDTVINPVTACKPLKDRGIIISVLYIPFQPISPVNASFANDEDDHANSNIPNIPDSLKNCASPPDAAGSYYYVANSPAEITASLAAMFNHSITTAHITN
jgi:Flp pilus assembly protein TadG